MDGIIDNDVVLLPEIHDEIFENELHKIVIRADEDYMELTKKGIVGEDEELISYPETRFLERIPVDGDSLLESFLHLWEESWIWEEKLVNEYGDYEVIINRKHNEIVLSKIVDELAYVNEEGVEFFNPIWTSKYFPLYPLSASDLMEQFEDFWELDPRQKFVLPKSSDEEYEIAGQVLENGIDLSEGYENFYTEKYLNDSHRGCVTYHSDGFIEINIVEPLNSDYRLLLNNGLKNFVCFPNTEYTAFVEITENTCDGLFQLHSNCFPAVSTGFGFVGKWQRTRMSLEDPKSGVCELRVPQNRVGKLKARVIFTKTPTPKPFIKNSRPDSKLALPQLSSLGNLEKIDTETGVAQHEQGTVIFKQPVFDPNAPHKDLVFGAHAHKVDGKWRLLCKAEEADAKFVGYNLLKYEDESDGSSVFYDVGRTSTANNIAGKITVDGKIYIGESYENLVVPGKINFSVSGSGQISRFGDFTNLLKVNTGDKFNSLVVSSASEKPTQRFTLQIVERRDGVVLGSKFISDTNNRSSLAVGEYIVPEGVNEIIFTAWLQTIGENTYSWKGLQITKTSTPKPFTDSTVPNGALKIAKGWTSESHSFVMKGIDSTNVNNVSFYIIQSDSEVADSNGYKGVCDAILTGGFKKLIVNGTYRELYRANLNLGGLYILNRPNLFQGRPLFKQILIYKGDLGQAKMEAELAKSIDLSSYHFQEDSVINTYGVKGFEKMYVYEKLTDEEALIEAGKDIDVRETGCPTHGMNEAEGVLIYADEAVVEDAEKDISISSYHWQDDSIINEYKIKGFSKMYIYDKLTEAEVAEEVQKDITLANKGHDYNIPNYLGEVTE